MPAWRTCARCEADLYPRLARRSERGWVCAHRSGCVRRARRAETASARTEDIRWLVETGESATGAAQRLGLTRDGLEAFCRRNGLRDELRTLLERDPRDHNAAQKGAVIAKRDRRRAA